MLWPRCRTPSHLALFIIVSQVTFLSCCQQGPAVPCKAQHVHLRGELEGMYDDLMQANKFTEAINLARKLIMLHPEAWSAHARLGQAMERYLEGGGQPSDSINSQYMIQAYRTAIEQSEAQIGLQEHYGLLLATLGRPEHQAEAAQVLLGAFSHLNSTASSTALSREDTKTYVRLAENTARALVQLSQHQMATDDVLLPATRVLISWPPGAIADSVLQEYVYNTTELARIVMVETRAYDKIADMYHDLVDLQPHYLPWYVKHILHLAVDGSSESAFVALDLGLKTIQRFPAADSTLSPSELAERREGLQKLYQVLGDISFRQRRFRESLKYYSKLRSVRALGQNIAVRQLLFQHKAMAGLMPAFVRLISKRSSEWSLEQDGVSIAAHVRQWPLPVEITNKVTRLVFNAQRDNVLQQATMKHREPFSVSNIAMAMKRGDRARIGILSSDFRLHPVGLSVRSMLRELASEPRIDVYCYSSYTPPPPSRAASSPRTQFEGGPDVEDESEVDDANEHHAHEETHASVHEDFKESVCSELWDIEFMPDTQVAQLIMDDKIHVLIDLNGMTEHNRLAVLFHKPAPIIVNYLGIPGTMGVDTFDYIIADPTSVPVFHAQHYTERLVYMPESFQVNDHRQEQVLNHAPVSRAAYGLPEEGETMIYCNFGSLEKVDEKLVAAWMSILRQVPKSVLWLLKKNDFEETWNGFLKMLGKYYPDFDQSRLVWAEFVPIAESRRRATLCDVFLDTPLYNAITTALDPLYAGVPVVTLSVETMVQRAGASQLKALGMSHLVARSMSEYVAKAVALSDGSYLEDTKATIKGRVSLSPLFDYVAFTSSFKRCLEMMIELSHFNHSNLHHVCPPSS